MFRQIYSFDVANEASKRTKIDIVFSLNGGTAENHVNSYKQRMELRLLCGSDY